MNRAPCALRSSRGCGGGSRRGLILAVAAHSTAVLRNGLGHYEAALDAARSAAAPKS